MATKVEVVRKTALLRRILIHGAARSMTVKELTKLGVRYPSRSGRDHFPQPRTLKERLSDLEGQGLLRRRDDTYMLGQSLGVGVGVSVGPEAIRGGLIDANGELWGSPAVHRSPGAWSLLDSPTTAAEGVDQVLKQLAAEVSPMQVPVVGVGVAFPSPIGRDHEVHASWLGSSWDRDRTAFVRQCQTHADDRLGRLPIEIINDANAEAWALAFDHARAHAQISSADAVLMTLHVGAGVGAGLIELGHFDPYEFSFCRSKLFKGAHGFSGELGHLRIAQHDIDDLPGHPGYRLESIEYGGCSCDAPSHLEGYVGTRALRRRLITSGYAREDETFESQWADLYQRQPAVTECLSDIGILLGKAFASAIRLVDPAEIRLTGPLGVPPVKDGMKSQVSLWREGVPHEVKISTGASPLEDGYELETLRGAGLAILRNHLYRRLEDVVRQRI